MVAIFRSLPPRDSRGFAHGCLEIFIFDKKTHRLWRPSCVRNLSTWIPKSLDPASRIGYYMYHIYNKSKKTHSFWMLGCVRKIFIWSPKSQESTHSPMGISKVSNLKRRRIHSGGQDLVAKSQPDYPRASRRPPLQKSFVKATFNTIVADQNVRLASKVWFCIDLGFSKRPKLRRHLEFEAPPIVKLLEKSSWHLKIKSCKKTFGIHIRILISGGCIYFQILFRHMLLLDAHFWFLIEIGFEMAPKTLMKRPGASKATPRDNLKSQPWRNRVFSLILNWLWDSPRLNSSWCF